MSASKLFLSILIGFFLSTASQDLPTPVAECPEVQSQENFDGSAFFKGRWYVMRIFGWVPKGTNSCNRIEFLTREKTNEIEMTYFSYNEGKASNATYVWTTKNPGEISYFGVYDYHMESGPKSLNYTAKVLKCYFLTIFNNNY